MSCRPPAIVASLGILTLGCLIGLTLADMRPRTLRAGAGDHPSAPIALTATFALDYNAEHKIAIENDAVCYLNYAKGYLLAAVPMPTQVGSASRLLSDFGQRDLLADFELPPGTEAHFTLASGKLGALAGGWAPLYVFESTTGQMAAYRIVPQARVGNSAPTITLMERRTDARLAAARRLHAAAR